MIKTLEKTGRTEDDAINAALAELGLDRDDVSVEILERAKSGFLGIGASPAVEKAIELFKERGTEAVSIKDICDRAAVTRNAFYYHFESKDLLFDSVGDWVSRISKERIQMIYEPDSYYQQFWEYYRAFPLRVEQVIMPS